MRRSSLLICVGALVAAGGANSAEPGGGRIAFSAGPLEPGRSQIYVHDIATHKTRQLTHDRRVNFDPALSPDGRRIAYRSMAADNDEIFVIDVDGAKRRNLTRSAAFDYSPSWSPDGTRIAFASTRAGRGVSHIWVMNADGSQAHVVTRRFSGEYPAWSPDGKRIAFATNEPVRQDGFDIAIVNADGTSAHRLTHNDVYEMGPAWSRDGKRLAYYAGNGGAHDLYVMRADGTQRRRLTHDTGELPTWSPDGRYLLYMGRSGLMVMRSDGSETRPLDVGRAWPTFPSWSR